MEAAIAVLLGFVVDIRPFLGGDSWTLGESALGFDTALGPGTLFQRYSFEAESTEALSTVQRQQLVELIDYMKPAHTHLVRIIEP
jgi:hypothetical protein